MKNNLVRVLSIRSLSLLFVISIIIVIPERSRATSSDFIINNGVLEKYNGNTEIIVIPDSVVKISSNVFAINSQVKEISMSNSVRSIDSGAFYGCTKLESVIFSNTLLSIGDGAFLACESLKNIVIPRSVINFGIGSFSGCDSLEKIDVESHNNNYVSIDGVVYSHDKSILIAYPSGKKGSFVIPSTVKVIGEHSFSFNDYLSAIVIPNSVIEIKSNAFIFCDSLEIAEIAPSVKIMDISNFEFCKSITVIRGNSSIAEELASRRSIKYTIVKQEQ